MREAVAALTTRGRAFLAAGGTALVCALLLGQQDLLRVAVLLVLLPLVTAFFLGRSRYRLGLVRSVAPSQVPAGQQARVQLDLSNDGRMPTGLLLLEDQVPYVLGTRPRFVIDRMSHGWKRTVDYPVRSDLRGKYVIGPMTVRLSDPFGLVELERAFRSTATLTVTPRVVPLPAVPLSGAWTGSGDNRPRAFATGSPEDVTVREYRRGDDLRRVHWRSSARVGELMVRREEQPWQSRATLFVDNRRFSHRGSGAASSLEHAISLAASIAVHLTQRGYRVRLATAAGAEGDRSWHDRGGTEVDRASLLESLATTVAVENPRIDTGWIREAGHTGLLVAVLGGVEDEDRPSLSQMRHSATHTLGLTLDVDAWSRGAVAPTASRPAVAWLTAQGWQATGLGPQDSFATAWLELGSLGRSGAVPHSRTGAR